MRPSWIEWRPWKPIWAPWAALFETRLYAIAEELRRAQARDEWLSTQLLDARRCLREQGRMLEEIRAALVREKQGFF